MFESVSCSYLNLRFLVTYSHALLIYTITLEKLAVCNQKENLHIVKVKSVI